MKTFAVLLLVHLIADFPLQTNRIFRMKLAGIRGLSLHVFIHLLVALFLIPTPWQYGSVLMVLVITHFVTDWTKVQLQRFDKPLLPGFILDQIVHILVIIMIAVWRPNVPSILPMWLIGPVIVFAFVPAFLMMGWVWANDRCQRNQQLGRKGVQWACRALLPMSQKVGWVVTAVVTVSSLVMVI
ncbi:MAG: DUF3307 domain-containing protein [Chloroflexi bacterium]|nr:DUF3307 domain-containing protein [Chloroflexota bacterium]